MRCYWANVLNEALPFRLIFNHFFVMHLCAICTATTTFPSRQISEMFVRYIKQFVESVFAVLGNDFVENL